MTYPGTITVTANEYNTLFIELDGQLIADSATFRRRRGFHNKLTGEWCYAKDFTPAKVKAAPALVTAYLAATGTETAAPIIVAL